MNKEMKEFLVDLKARQLAGERMPCPRCGYNDMNEDVHKNNISRRADAYICDECYEREAALIEKNVSRLEYGWACYEYGIKRADKRTQTVKEIQELVEGGQIEHLMDLFEHLEDIDLDEGFAEHEWARLETMRKCPGVAGISTTPGVRARYECKDGTVNVEVRRRGKNIEYRVGVVGR